MNNFYIMHYGVGHDKGGHSGRYPWGSGEKIKRAIKTVRERGVNDVVAEKIARKNQEKFQLTEEQYLYNKERTKALISNVEKYTIGTLVGITFGTAGTLALRGYYTYKDIQKANNDVDNFINNHNNMQVENIYKEDRK